MQYFFLENLNENWYTFIKLNLLMFCLFFFLSYIFMISGFLLKMELSKDIPQEKVPFTKEKSILNDIAQETKELPGYGSLTEEELMEKVESILLERIKNGEKRAYFQLGLFYHEQVWMEIYCTAWVLHCTLCLCITLVYYPFTFVSKWICMCIKNRLKTSTYSKEISETIVYKLVKKKLRFANDYR